MLFVVISMGSNLSGSCGLVPFTSLVTVVLSFVWRLIMVASLSCSAADSCSSVVISIVVVGISPVISSCRKPPNLVSNSSSSDAASSSPDVDLDNSSVFDSSRLGSASSSVDVVCSSSLGSGSDSECGSVYHPSLSSG